MVQLLTLIFYIENLHVYRYMVAEGPVSFTDTLVTIRYIGNQLYS